jgi:hypothetical protein
MTDLGMTDLTPIRLVAMKMLRMDRGLIEELSSKPFRDIDVVQLIRRRSGTHYEGERNDWGNEYYQAARDIVREISLR